MILDSKSPGNRGYVFMAFWSLGVQAALRCPPPVTTDHLSVRPADYANLYWGRHLVRLLCLLAILLASLAGLPALADAPVLVMTTGGATRQLTADDLRAWPDAATIAVPNDPAYGRAISYRAVPLRALLSALPPDATDTIQARASDGFVAEIPRALISGAATPWIAFEDTAQPWPPLPGRPASAGPFYLVWQDPERAGISSEQWVYALAALTAVPSPAQRWPAIAVDPSAPENAPARQGQVVFIANCLPCHRLGGAGEGTVGPDLLRPMPATAYFTEAGLRALIRNSAAVRHWPAQQMPAFNDTALPDSAIEAVIAYLRYLATRPK
jgi:mono/diheme cytochrome c family protein